MKSVLKSGVCVSCGREPGRFYRTCPYCGEQVWQPRWRRAVQWALVALPPLLLMLLASIAQPDMGRFAQTMRSIHPLLGFLFAAGIGLLLLPPQDSDLVVTSRAESLRWQAGSIFGGWLMGVYAVAVAVCLNYGHATGATAWLSAGLTMAGAGAAPCFFRIPWRSLGAAALLAATLALL